MLELEAPTRPVVGSRKTGSVLSMVTDFTRRCQHARRCAVHGC